MAGSAVERQLIDRPLEARREEEFRRACLEDEAALRRMLRDGTMPGDVRIALTREPDYFAGENILGARDLTIVARRKGEIVCMGRCSNRELYVAGANRRVGYLAELRLQPGERASPRLLRGGYDFFRRSALAEEKSDLYFTSISSENARARRVLENGRRLGLPAYSALGELITLASPVSGYQGAKAKITRAHDRDELEAFLNQAARRRDLALVWSEATWATLEKLRMSWRDFFIVRRSGKIAAAAAIWDQRAFRQTTIQSYSFRMRVLRPLVNALHRLRGRPLLPKAPAVLAQGALFGLQVAEESAWPDLWAAVSSEAVARRLDWLVWSHDSRDETRARFRPPGAWRYRSHLYAVAWDERELHGLLPRALFQPEVALL